MHDVVVLPGERMAYAIFARRPVHRFLRYIDWAKKYDGAGGSLQYAITGLAASEYRGPAVDLRYIGVSENE